MGINERIWAMHHAQYYRSNTDPEMPSEYVDLIEKYLLVVPHLTQHKSNSADLLQPTLWQTTSISTPSTRIALKKRDHW
ncbi:hypothetical protein GB937_009063 [Aspergillus fischeri]|nr:hypothetical protein GB937_009063 [Aspergillus fischeri]